MLVAEANPVDYGCFAIIYTHIHILYIYIYILYTCRNDSVGKATVLALLALLPAFLKFLELPSGDAFT